MQQQFSHSHSILTTYTFVILMVVSIISSALVDDVFKGADLDKNEELSYCEYIVSLLIPRYHSFSNLNPNMSAAY